VTATCQFFDLNVAGSSDKRRLAGGTCGLDRPPDHAVEDAMVVEAGDHVEFLVEARTRELVAHVDGGQSSGLGPRSKYVDRTM
jgi:hypothetical protein